MSGAFMEGILGSIADRGRALPRNAMGKIQKKALREAFADTYG